MLQGLVHSIAGRTGAIRSEDYEGLPFLVSDTFSDHELGPDDLGQEVEFTVKTVGPSSQVPPHRSLLGPSS